MKPRMTMDEIDALIDEIAQDPESGADRFRALKMLKTDSTVGAAAPPVMTPDEMVQRISRLMLPAGEALCQVAFRRAFPKRGKPLNIEDTPQLGVEDLSPELKEQARNITSVKKLRKEFPETKQHGVPKGYPTRRGIAVQLEWLRLAAERMFADRENAKIAPEVPKGIDELASQAAKSRAESQSQSEPQPDGAQAPPTSG